MNNFLFKTLSTLCMKMCQLNYKIFTEYCDSWTMHPKSHTFGKGKNSVLNAKIFGLFTTFKFLFSIVVILFNLFFLLKSNKPIIKTSSKLYQSITTNGKNKVASIRLIVTASKRKRQYRTRKNACFVKNKPYATLRISTSHRDVVLS